MERIYSAYKFVVGNIVHACSAVEESKNMQKLQCIEKVKHVREVLYKALCDD